MATTEELLQTILQSLEKVEYIKSEDIPNIDLYMDQVLTFMDRKLRSAVRPQTEDRVLTKTMINNYAKNKLLPPPEKKRYSRENLLMLIIGVAAVRNAVRMLSLRFERPPAQGGSKQQEQQIVENLNVFATRHKLSQREREVLYLILLGKDNQNIASEMSLALSTVKVHVHNILKKTGDASRQELIQGFWKMS